MLRRLVPACIAALCLGLPAAAQVPFDADLYSIAHQKFVLNNGLTLLVHEDHSVPVVAVNMWYHVGSRNEQRGKTGFAHLFEHFFFNGSENHPSGFREAMDDLGANNRNGTTNPDRTNFFEDVPTSALERTLFLEADRMGFLGNYISEAMLVREKGVVQNEKRQGENQPYGKVFGEILGKVYPYSHPYSWSTIGEMADIDAATLDDIRQWYATYYGPNNAVISLAGDITPARALELVTKYFGDIPPGPALARADEWVPVLERNIRDRMQDRVPQHRIYRVWHAPGWGSDEALYLELFADVLAGSKSSPLSRRLVYEEALATNVTAGMRTTELGGMFTVTVTVRDSVDPATAERALDAVLADVLDQRISRDALTRFQNRNLARFLRGSERLGGRGGRSDILAEAETYGGRPGAYLDQLATMAAATPEAVSTAARSWLTANHYTMLVEPAPQLNTEPAAVDRSQVPALGEPPSVTFPKIQRATLANGLEVLLLERHSAPIVNVTLAIDAGSASDAPDTAGLASLALDLLDEGTTTRDAFEIADELDALGATLGTSSDLDLSYVRLQAVADKLQPALTLLADVVLRPAFPEDQFGIQQRRRLADIAQEQANPNALAQRVMTTVLYGADHAYGTPASGFTSTVAALQRDDLIAWHGTWFRPGSTTVIVSGDATLDAIMPMLERTFGGWAGGRAPEKRLTSVPRTPGRRIYLIDKPDAEQSTILAAHVSATSGQPEDLAGEPLFQNFGGMSTSRLNRNLRLDKHWSYGTGGGLRDARGQRPFFVIAPVQTDRTKESMVEVLREIRDIAGERPITGDEFDSIMRNMTSRLAGRFETLASLDSAAIDVVAYGLADSYWADYASNMRGLTEADLAAAGRRFVRPDEIVWIVVGDLAVIEDGIRELDFGEVVRLSADGAPAQ